MNIFFGKISKKFDLNQIEEGYYKSPKGSSWFGEIEIDDYVYIIGGDKIQLWRAKEWGTKDNEECLWFEIINNNLNINLNKFTALNFFKLTPSLIVLTSRSAKNKAFFKLETLQDLSLDYISKTETYQNNNIYRKILIHKSEKSIEKQSKDIQLFYDNKKLKLYETDFFEKRVIESFRDNIKFGGKGSIRKDNVIKLIKSKERNPFSVFTNSEMSMRSLYDTLFCEYIEKEKYYLVGAYWDDRTPQNQTDRFTDNNIWENGYTDKFLNEVNKIPVNAHLAIKSVYTKEKTKSVMLIKARGIVTKNHKNGRFLDIEWEDDFTPFEVNFSGGYWNTVSEVKKQAHISIIWSEKTNTEKIETEKECLSPLNQILFGPPGTGKTYHTIDKSVEIANNKRYKEIFTIEDEKKRRKELKKEFKKLKENNQIIFTTFHQSMSYEEFVEGLKPDVDKKTKEIFYEVKKGIFRRICIKAEENPTENYVLIIDEINRGNIASVFGELITLIEPDKRKGEDEELFVELPYSKTEFTVPKNLYIIGTMNTADRSVEALDSALRRRFVFEEMPPNENLLKNDFYSINLQKVLEQINTRIEKLIDKDHKIGHSYFMKLTEISDLQNTFKNKLIPLLEEYFYGDFAKIGLILGKDFIKKENTEENIFKNIDNDEDYSDFESRIIYKIIVPNQAEKFVDAIKNIYL